jgi:hypothetical protein
VDDDEDEEDEEDEEDYVDDGGGVDVCSKVQGTSWGFITGGTQKKARERREGEEKNWGKREPPIHH